MKKLLRILFPMVVLLLSGYGQLYADSPSAVAGRASLNILINTPHASQARAESIKALALRSSSQSEHGLEIEAIDIEEEEEHFAKKSFLGNPAITAILIAHLLGFVFSDLKRGIPFNGFFSTYSSRRRYVLFSVFRI